MAPHYSHSILPIPSPLVCSLSCCEANAAKDCTERPIPLVIALLATVAILCILLGRHLFRTATNATPHIYTAIPLEDVDRPHEAQERSQGQEDARHPSSLRNLRIAFLVLVLAICGRIEIFRRVVWDIQCAGQSSQVRQKDNILSHMRAHRLMTTGIAPLRIQSTRLRPDQTTPDTSARRR